MNFKVLDIIKGTTVDGPGFRTSIYLAGCNHKCVGCQNPQSWDPLNGKNMTLQEILDVVEEEDFDVSISGGDPLFYPDNLKTLIRELKKNKRNVWVYTGYEWEDIIQSENLFQSIKEADVLVDGPFIEALKDLDLPFRGSTNQRLIDIQKTLASGNIVIINR